MNKRTSRDLRVITRVEDMFAENDLAALEVLMENSLAELGAGLAADRKKREYLMQRLTQQLEYLTQHARAHLKTPREQRKRQAAFIRRVRDGAAAELKRRGMRNPVAQAEEEVAKQYGFRSGAALNKWLRRNC